ncbi:MAG: amino acid ABC transporter substrate-binding protein [Betaproteobacteria bacterium]|nr:amino acid ABC transporter substrate-binding protein [Betaproteobacteria bacterium]
MSRAAMPLFAAMLAVLPISPGIGAPPGNPKTLSKIRNAGVIVIGHRASSIPFSYQAGASAPPLGYSISICERIVGAIRTHLRLPNVRIQYQPVSPENRVSLLTNDRIDMECGSTTNTEARRKEVEFSTTTFVAATRVLVPKGASIKSLRDLNGHRVAVTHGTTNEQILEQISRDQKLSIELIRGNDHDTSYASLKSGKAAAVAMDDILLIGMITDAGDQGKFEFLDETLSSEPYGIMIRKDDPNFKKLVNGAINDMIDRGVMAKLYLQWFRSPIPPKRVNLGLPFTADMAKVLKLLPK